MADPSENAREAFRILRPGGMVFVTTPNQETFSEDQKRAGHGWYRVPLQLYFFTKETIDRLLAAQGFCQRRNLRERHDPFVEMIGFKT